jgi:hypothetical protein
MAQPGELGSDSVEVSIWPAEGAALEELALAVALFALESGYEIEPLEQLLEAERPGAAASGQVGSRPEVSALKPLKPTKFITFKGLRGIKGIKGHQSLKGIERVEATKDHGRIEIVAMPGDVSAYKNKGFPVLRKRPSSNEIAEAKVVLADALVRQRRKRRARADNGGGR